MCVPVVCVCVCRPPVSEGITPLQESLQAASLHDTSLSLTTVPEEAVAAQWVDMDAAEGNNPLYASEYAEDICQYMKRREVRMGSWFKGDGGGGLDWECNCEAELGLGVE